MKSSYKQLLRAREGEKLGPETLIRKTKGQVSTGHQSSPEKRKRRRRKRLKINERKRNYIYESCVDVIVK